MLGTLESAKLGGKTVSGIKTAAPLFIVLPILVLAGCSVLGTVTNPGDWMAHVPELILKGLGILLSAASSIWLVPKLQRKTRASLRTDLEILKLMNDVDHPQKSVVRDCVDARVRTIYAKATDRAGGRPQIKNIPIFILGIVCLPLFSIWTFKIYGNGWWVLTGFLAFISLGWIIIAFEEPGTKADTKSKT